LGRHYIKTCPHIVFELAKYVNHFQVVPALLKEISENLANENDKIPLNTITLPHTPTTEIVVVAMYSKKNLWRTTQYIG
jgi:hypothetical protein